MGSKLSAMGVSGVGTRLVSGGMGGHRNSISFDRSGEFLFCLLFASSIKIILVSMSEFGLLEARLIQIPT